MAEQHNVLILQGGGALGAYQAGVYQQLHQHFAPIDWVIGTSIGAINSALIAGNPPARRVEHLRAFWDSLAPTATHRAGFWPAIGPWNAVQNMVGLMDTFVNGVDGFFRPRLSAFFDINARVALADAAFYDTSPLKDTLEKYVDFDYLNSGATRISVCAVDIDSGQGVVFDNRRERIGPEHIMASGALPPGFPPVEIDGHAYWDGGVYSNSPIEVFLEDDARVDALCFMVDLWDPTEARPASIAEAMARYKSIQYASRSREQLETHERLQNLQRAIRTLSDRLPPAERAQLSELVALGCDHTVNVVHLIMKAMPGELYFKDVDFSAPTIGARWQAGIDDCRRALAHKAWLRPLPPHAGLIIHELPQR